MKTLAERQQAASEAFSPVQRSQLVRAVGMLTDQLTKLKKKEAELGVDFHGTNKILSILNGTETEPGITKILADPNGAGAQTDAWLDEAPHAAGEAPEDEEGPVNLVADEDGVHVADEAPAEAEGPKADPDAPDPEEEEEESETEEGGGGDGESEATSEEEAETPADLSAWTDDVLAQRGEELPKSLPFRGSLVSSGVTFGRIVKLARSGNLTTLKGVGLGGAEKITAWIDEAEAKIAGVVGSDPEPQDDEEEPEATDDTVGEAPQPTDDDDLRALLKGNEEVFSEDGGVLAVNQYRAGCQLAFQRPNEGAATYWPTEPPYPDLEDAVTAAVYVAKGGTKAWDVLKRTTVAEFFATHEPDGGEEAEEPDPPTDGAGEASDVSGELVDPDVGHVVVVPGLPHKPARRLYIGGITRIDPELCSLVDSIEVGENGEIVKRGELVARVKLLYLKSTLTRGEFTVERSKVGFVE